VRYETRAATALASAAVCLQGTFRWVASGQVQFTVRRGMNEIRVAYLPFSPVKAEASTMVPSKVASLRPVTATVEALAARTGLVAAVSAVSASLMFMLFSLPDY